MSTIRDEEWALRQMRSTVKSHLEFLEIATREALDGSWWGEMLEMTVAVLLRMPIDRSSIRDKLIQLASRVSGEKERDVAARAALLV